MSKLIEISDDVQRLVDSVLNSDSELLSYGIQVEVIGVTKAKATEIVKVAKASEITEHYAKKTDMVLIYIYEAAFERLDESTQRILIENAIAGIDYDNEKDKINILKPNINVHSSIYKTHQFAAINALEAAYNVVEQMEQEERDEKEAKKIERAEKKRQKEEAKAAKRGEYMSVIDEN